MCQIQRILDFLIHSALISTLLTAVTFCFYSLVLGISLVPSFLILYNAVNWLLADVSAGRILAFCFIVPLSMYVFFGTAAIVFGIFERVITYGMKPGKYPTTSLTFVRWLINGGLHTVALNTFLPFVQGTAFFKLFLRICGCKIGKDVFINTKNLNDVYLLEVQDNVVIGGSTDITCHLFENGKLVLDHIFIGKGSLVGANCKLGPGIRIGENCTIGMDSYVRRGKDIKDSSVLISLPAMPIRDMVRIMNRKD